MQSSISRPIIVFVAAIGICMDAYASEIERQARARGVRHYHDCGICTATYLKRYYSYRAEKGKTGRMWAVLMIE